jgi:hypothetical protein
MSRAAMGVTNAIIVRKAANVSYVIVALMRQQEATTLK